MDEHETIEKVMGYAQGLLDCAVSLIDGEDLTQQDCRNMSAALGIVQQQFNLFTETSVNAPMIDVSEKLITP